MCGPLSNLVELWFIVLRIMMMMMMKWIMEELLLDDIKVCLRHFYSDRNQHLTHLTHWGRDKMDAISQTTLWSAFSWMKNVWIPIEISYPNENKSLFLRVQLTIFQHWFRSWLGAVQATSHYLNQWWLDYRRIYASLGLNELMMQYSTGIIDLGCQKMSLEEHITTGSSIYKNCSPCEPK